MADEFVPVIEIPVKSAANIDRASLLSALSRLTADDVQFRFVLNDQTGDVLLAGIDELQLDQKIDALRRVPGAAISIGAPQIAFRETMMRRAEVAYTHKKLFGSAGEFAKVKLALEPAGPESGYACQFKTASAVLPDEYVAGIKAGVETALGAGIVAGFPVIGVAATVVDGGFHELDSSAAAFTIAARGAVREALQAGNAVVLEPVVKVEVVAPEDCVERIIGDLATRRAFVVSRDKREGQSVIVATVPATNMLGYAGSLRSMSGGRATYGVQFDHYAPVSPPDDPRFQPAAAMRA
jgi:elongation factor G